MIEPRCPDCLSPEIEPDPDSATGRWWCENCGERFDLESAFIQLREAEDFRSETEPEPMFHLHRELAEMELRAPDGAIRALNPYSDVEELHRVLDAAMARGAIEPRRTGATLHAYLRPGAPPHPVLAVDPGLGAVMIGPELALRPERGEDPVSYTLRRLDQMVAAANTLLGGRPHGSSGGRQADQTRTVGPRSHRPAPGSRSQRRYLGSAQWHHGDATIGKRFEAEAMTISGVLAELGERIEADELDQDADTLAVTVTLGGDGCDGTGSPR